MNTLRFSNSNTTLTKPGFWVDVATYSLENRIVTVYDGDDYRFGLKVLTEESVFNTQEKVDEPKHSEALEDPYQNKRTEKIAGKGIRNMAQKLHSTDIHGDAIYPDYGLESNKPGMIKPTMTETEQIINKNTLDNRVTNE